MPDENPLSVNITFLIQTVGTLAAVSYCLVCLEIRNRSFMVCLCLGVLTEKLR